MLIGGVLRSAVGQDVMVLVGFIGGVVRGLIWGVDRWCSPERCGARCYGISGGLIGDVLRSAVGASC